MSKIIYFFIGALVAEIVHLIISIFKKRWGYSETIKQCSYAPLYGDGEVSVHNVIVRKKKGKVIDINCPWYNKRVKVEYKNKVYLNCGWGNRYMEDKNQNFDGGICPFADN